MSVPPHGLRNKKKKTKKNKTNDFERGLLPRPAQVWPRHGLTWLLFLFCLVFDFSSDIMSVPPRGLRNKGKNKQKQNKNNNTKQTNDFEKGLLPRPAQVWPRHGLNVLFFVVFCFLLFLLRSCECATTRSQEQRPKNTKDFERGLLPRPAQVWPRQFCFCFSSDLVSVPPHGLRNKGKQNHRF